MSRSATSRRRNDLIVMFSISLSPYVIQTILGAVSVVGTVPALYLIETWGRRKVRLVLASYLNTI